MDLSALALDEARNPHTTSLIAIHSLAPDSHFSNRKDFGRVVLIRVRVSAKSKGFRHRQKLKVRSEVRPEEFR